MSGFKGSNAPPITDTGMRGFLKWYQREQPELYQQVAPKIATLAPEVFGDYNQSVTASVRNLAAYTAQRRRTRVLGRLGQDTTDYGYNLNPDLTVSTSSITGVGSDVPQGAIDAVALQTPPIDTADAANTSTTPGTTTSAIGSMIAGITGLYVAANQQQTANAITQLQLQRASQGLSPLNISMGANGVPTITGISGSLGTVLLIGGAALALMLILGSSRKAA